MGEPVEVRPLSSLEDVRAASALLDRIWQERRVMGAPLLRALAAHGGQVLGAFEGDVMVGTLVGLVGLTEDRRPVVHSHITGVAPEAQHRGVGFLLKRAQRDWCLARGIDVVTWTMDPMVARNARFNLHKLGALGVAFHRDYYGPMDDAFNRGERSDRLEIRWDLRSRRVKAAMKNQPVKPKIRFGLTMVSVDASGRPKVGAPHPDATNVDLRRFKTSKGVGLLVAVPADYHALRETDPQTARDWRDKVADAFEGAFEDGWEATGFHHGQTDDLIGEGAYVLERS